MHSPILSTSVLVGTLFISFSQAYWRLSCGLSQTSRIDPITNPGTLSGHVHKFAGASNVNAKSTYESLLQAPCSSCEIQDDKSAYWTPSLYYQHSNGSFEEVPNRGMAVYYEGRGDDRNLQPFPPGFRMVSGDKRLRSYNENHLIPGSDRPVSDRVSFACLNGYVNKEQPWLESTNCKDGLRAQVHFQSCWNGRDLYKQDNSHVEYMSRLDNGVCPSSHPVPLIHLFYEVLYGVNDIKPSGGKFVFSHGDTTGYGFHGDFMNGWKSDVLTAAIKECAFTNEGGVQYCPAFKPSWDSRFDQNCPEQPSILNEPVHGMIDKLPGCITVTSGPQDAKESDMNCANGRKPRSLLEDSLPQSGSKSLEERTVPEGDYGYGYDFDLPTAATRGPPPTYGSPKPRPKRSQPLDAVSEEDYGYGYDYNQPTTTTRGPPPSYGSPKPRSKRSQPLDSVTDEEYGYGYDNEWPTTTRRGPSIANGSPKPYHGRGNHGYQALDNVLEA